MRLKKFDQIRNFSQNVNGYTFVLLDVCLLCVFLNICVFFDVSVCKGGFYARVY